MAQSSSECPNSNYIIMGNELTVWTNGNLPAGTQITLDPAPQCNCQFSSAQSWTHRVSPLHRDLAHSEERKACTDCEPNHPMGHFSTVIKLVNVAHYITFHETGLVCPIAGCNVQFNGDTTFDRRKQAKKHVQAQAQVPIAICMLNGCFAVFATEEQANKHDCKKEKRDGTPIPPKVVFDLFQKTIWQSLPKNMKPGP